MSKKDPHINETLEKLEELAQGYQRALECSNQIISIKDRYIELCEMETGLYKKEIISLQRTVFWLSICLGAVSVGSLLLYIL